MIRNEELEITESAAQKWTSPGQQGKSRDNRKPQRQATLQDLRKVTEAAGQMWWVQARESRAPTPLKARGKAATGEGERRLVAP